MIRAIALIPLMLLAGCGPATRKPPQAAAPATATPLGKGYLPRAELPDALLLIPAPPAAGSAAFARDEEASRAAIALKASPRWMLATADADLSTPRATGAMSCAAGFEIAPAATPAIDRLLRHVLPDLGLASAGAKQLHARPRPFMVNGAGSCTPDQEADLRKNGSYPSGHSSVGHGWGLILAEIIPDRAAHLVARGRAFGDSRRLCNVHWLSDVEEGRIIADAVVARLHASSVFLADLNAARAEVTAARRVAPARDCAQEAAALAL